ncbi:MAG: nucleotidyltransferase domain-containing protein [Planctomycetes bacterium]|nr:nucleotidyltransferase domain-containing protein [Planctomycetota bacterium]
MTVSVEQTVATLRRRAAAKRSAAIAAARDVRAHLDRELATCLPPESTVWLIGSLAWGGFGEHSDIDLVVRGGSAAAAWASDVEVRLTRRLGVPVEILDFDQLPVSFRARVEREGVLLHGR